RSRSSSSSCWKRKPCDSEAARWDGLLTSGYDDERHRQNRGAGDETVDGANGDPLRHDRDRRSAIHPSSGDIAVAEDPDGDRDLSDDGKGNGMGEQGQIAKSLRDEEEGVKVDREVEVLRIVPTAKKDREDRG